MLYAALLALVLGQWIKEPTRGIPRTADGKPNLTAPAPKLADGHPDLSGLWRMDTGAYGNNVAADAPGKVKPWAKKLAEERAENLWSDHMAVHCLPLGAGIVSSGGGMAKFVHTPGLLVMLYEDLTHRQIFLDGRELPKDPNPAWMGYSVGHWDGDTLVVESSGFNDRAWADFFGHPITEKLRITERYRRKDFGHLEMKATYRDDDVFDGPMEISGKGDLAADTEMLEYVCAENEKDRSAGHLVGTASDDKKLAVPVAPEILARYVGGYEFRNPEIPDMPFTLNVVLKGKEVFVDFEGKDPQPMIPLSNTLFSALGARIEFFMNAAGKVDHAMFKIVEGDMKGVPKPRP